MTHEELEQANVRLQDVLKQRSITEYVGDCSVDGHIILDGQFSLDDLLAMIAAIKGPIP